MKRKTLLAGLFCLAISATTISAQENIQVDHAKWVFDPLAKRFGVNIPASTSFDLLKNHANDLKDLNLRYVRVSTGWGQEATGNLYDTEQVLVSGDNITYKYDRIDEVVGIITAGGAQPLFISRCPKAFGASASSVPETTSNAWYNLHKDFAAHWTTKAIKGVSYEILEGVETPAFFQGSAEDYANIYQLAAQGIIDGENRSHILSKVMPASSIGAFNPDAKNLINNRNMHGLAGQATGFDELKKKLTESGEFREQANATFEWEVFVSAFNPADNKTAASVNNEAVIAFLNAAEMVLDYSDVTHIYMSQLLDGNDGTKGLIGADGSKTALYYALKLYNEMPMDRKEVKGLDKLKALASSDSHSAATVIWNTSGAEQSATITMNNIPFNVGTVKMYTIDAAHSTNGTLAVEELGTLNGNSYAKNITIPINGSVFLIAKNDQKVPTYSMPGQYVNDHHMWWFKFSEPWAWHIFDPNTMTIYLGDRNYASKYGKEDAGDWGVSHMAVDLKDVPEQINVKVDMIGKTEWKDANSAVYFRIDYERAFVDEEEGESMIYYGSSVVYADKVHAVFDPDHGSNPTSYPNGEKETAVEEVDYTTTDGIVVDLKKNAPRDWTGNIRIIAYLQNPGAHEQGCMYKFQFRGSQNGTGLAKTSVEEKNNIQVYPTLVTDLLNIETTNGKILSIQIVDLSGRTVINEKSNEDTHTTLSLNTLIQGTYLVVVNTELGITTKKIIRR